MSRNLLGGTFSPVKSKLSRDDKRITNFFANFKLGIFALSSYFALSVFADFTNHESFLYAL